MIRGDNKAGTASWGSICPLCKTNPARENGTVCTICLGLEKGPDCTAPQIAQSSPSITLDSASLICPICGITHAGFKMGRNSTSKVCKECIVAKRKLTKAKNQNKAADSRRKLTGKTLPKIKDQEHSLMSDALKSSPATEPKDSIIPPTTAETPLPVPPAAPPPPPRMITPKNLDHQLLLDFTDYPELLDRIKTIARSEMRTPKAQIFWMIKHAHINEG